MSTERVATLVLAAIAGGCSPYSDAVRDYYGSVDPQSFPAAYAGNSDGEIAPVAAWSGGQRIGYYAFPLPAKQAGADDPLALSSLPVARAYVFDPAPPSPFPPTPRCAVPAGYQYDQRRDAYRYDEQGNVFVTLPDTKGYVPVVGEVPVQSGLERCQDDKSEAQILADRRLTVPRVPGAVSGTPDGRYLAWPIINPEAIVANPDGSLPDATQPPYTGLGPQKWGWYDHYLLAYLDGGYLPTEQAMSSTGDGLVTRAVAQRLYYPTMVLDHGKVGPGSPGAGFDLVEARRGDAAYSPLCHVFSYVPSDPNAPARDVAEIDAAINQVTDTGSYVYCLQLQ